jgi:predicted alpha/beta-hydrolase family hydrolase
LVEPSARYEELKIPLPEPAHGIEQVSAVLGIPRWWPTGARLGVVMAHGAASDMNDPVIAYLHRELTERRFLSLRFNFPFAETRTPAGKWRRPDPLTALRRCFRAAIGALARDPTAAPAHLFLAGKGLGAQVAADLSISRIRADGLILMSYPLHPANKPEQAEADQLYRVVAPMLFLQGTRDRYCDLEVLRQTLSRVGAPTALYVAQEADHRFKVPKKAERPEEEIYAEMLGVVDSWIDRILEA